MTPFMLLAATAALAQQPEPSSAEETSAARSCADAAVGREVDVCLRLAAEHPDEVDEIAAALRAHMDRSADDDRDLLAAMLLLLSPDAGVEGARRLGDLGDPRAVEPLAHAGETREVEVAIAAALALAQYREGLEPLARWLTERAMPTEVRVASADAIGRMGAEEGGDALITALRSRGVPPALRQAMIASIQAHFPGRVPELEHQVTQDGTWWLVGGGGWALGYGLGLAGYLGQAELAGLGAATGTVAGGTAGWVAGRAWPMEAADASFLTTSGVAGSLSGVMIGAAVSPDSIRGAWWGGLAGQGAGFGLGYGLRKAHPGTVGDAIEATLFGGATSLAAGVTFDFASGWRGSFEGATNVPLLAAGLGLAGGTALGHAIAPNIDIEGNDPYLILLSSTYGLGVGSLAPVSTDRRGLPAAGLALGAVVGYGLAGVVDPPRDVLFGAAVGMGYGAAIGAGIGMLADPLATSGGDAPRGGALTGGTLGLGIAAWAAYRNPEPPNTNDIVLTGLVTGWAAWQSAGWFRVLFPHPRYDGVFLMIPPALGAATAAASPLLDVPLIYSFAGLSLGLWGGYLGGTFAQFSGARGDDLVSWALIGSDLGLGVGVLLAAPPFAIPPLVIGLADGGAVMGGAIAALGASFFVNPRSPNGVDTILGASVGGVVIGFGAGALFGRALHRSGRARDVAMVLPLPGRPALGGRWTVAPTALPTTAGEPAYGAVLQVTEW